MSFGYGVGDIIAVTQLAWKCVRNARDACGEHDALTREVNSLHSLLSQLQLEKANPESLLRQDDDRNEELNRLVANCEEVLSEIDSILDKYSALTDVKSGKAKRTWQKVKFGNDEMQALIRLRQKMGHHTQSIVLFCNLLSMGSQGRIEKYMRSSGGEMRELCLAINSSLAQLIDYGKPEGSVLTIYSDDDSNIWKDLRRQLVLEGHKSDAIRENFENIKAYVRELSTRGVLDDNRKDEFVPPRAIEGPVKWQLDQAAWQDLLSQSPLHVNQVGPQPSSMFIKEIQRLSRMHGIHHSLQHSAEQTIKLSAQSNSAKKDIGFTTGKAKLPVRSHLEQKAGSSSPDIQRGLPLELGAIIEIKRRSLPIDTSHTSHVTEDEAQQEFPNDEIVALSQSGSDQSFEIREPLRLLSSHQPISRQKYCVNIIVLPEIEFLGLAKPSIPHWKWLNENLAANIPGCRILDFEYSLHRATFSYLNLLDLGTDLLDGILSQDIKFLELPIIFVCHGLSGFILKRALANARQRYYNHDMLRLLEALSGIIFLGCPHPRPEYPDSLSSLSRLLKIISRAPKPILAKAEIEFTVLVNTCRDFEDSDLGVDVISAYETIETRVRTGLRRQKSMMVDLGLATTRSSGERLIPVASDHWNICHFSASSAIFRKIDTFVKAAISSHLERPHPPQLEVTRRLSANSWSSTASLTTAHQRPSPETGKSAVENSTSVMWSNAATFGGTTTPGDFVLTIPNDFTDSCQHEPKLPVFFVPRRQNRQFWGRRGILEKLDTVLQQNISARSQRFAERATEGTSCVVMTGLGGVGKTELALQYAYSRRNNFDLVFWISADGNVKLADDIARLSAALGLESLGEAGDRIIQRNRVLGWLTSTERSWLLIFDNADDMELLNDYWPLSSNGAIIVTSRDPVAPWQFYGASGIVVDPFPAEEGAAFLRSLTMKYAHTIPEDDKAVHKIAIYLGGLPLAITQMASVIRRLRLSYRDFIELYNSEFSTLADENNLQIPHTLSTVWSFEQLRDISRRVLDVLSFLEPDHIPESMLQHNSFTNSDPTVYCRAQDDLLRSSLITLNQARSEISIHRVVQDVVRSKMSTTEASKAFAVALVLLKDSWPQLVDPFVGSSASNSKGDVCVGHLLRMTALYQQAGSLVKLQNLDTTQTFVELLQLGGWHLFKRGSFLTAHSLFSHALSIYKENYMTEPKILADTLFSLATVEIETNQHSAEIFEHTLEHLQVRINLNCGERKDQENLSMAHCRVAQGYIFGGEYTKAIDHCKLSQSVLSVDPENCEWYQWSQIFQAWCLIAMTNLEEAESVILAQFQYQTEHLPSKESGSLIMAHTLKCMAALRSRQDLLEESFSIYGGALSNFVATIGYNSYDSNLMCVKLGVHHTRLDQFEIAGIYLEQALKWFSIHKYYAGEVTYVMYKMALLRKAQGDEIGAGELLGKTEKLYSKLVPTYNKKRWLSDADIDGLVVLTSR